MESALKRNKKETTHPPSRRNLAQNLLMARTIWGWSQEDLGLQCGLKRTYIGAIERHEINPGVDNLDRLAAAMGLAGYALIMDPEHAYPLLYRARNGG